MDVQHGTDQGTDGRAGSARRDTSQNAVLVALADLADAAEQVARQHT